MRRLSAHRLAPLVLLSVAAVPACTCAPSCQGPQVSPCGQIPVAQGACGRYRQAGDPAGAPVCACPVTLSDPGAPACVSPDARAPLTVSFIRRASPGQFGFGTVPVPDGGEPMDLDEVLSPDRLVTSGKIPIDVDALHHVDWIEPSFSPDGAMMALFARIRPGEERSVTMARCAGAEDPGWMVERFIRPVTAPFVRWGAATGDRRQLYVMADDMLRLTFVTEPKDVVASRAGSPVPAVVIEGAEVLARSEQGRLAIGDFDVSFETDADGASRDRYAVFMSGLAARPLPLYVRAGIYVMDLSDCRAGCSDDPGLHFCCRTALLTVGDSDYPDTPTNPALSSDGSLIAFNRFTTSPDECPLGLCAQVHVVKNPFAFPAVWDAHCTGRGGDGFTDAVDCSSLISRQGHLDPARCPDYHCCGEAGADCSACVSIGERPGEERACAYEPEGVRERNYLAFFQLGATTYLAFRSQDLRGDREQDLHVYRVGTAEDGRLDVPSEGFPRIIREAAFDGSDLLRFGPAPHRRLPAR